MTTNLPTYMSPAKYFTLNNSENDKFKANDTNGFGFLII